MINLLTSALGGDGESLQSSAALVSIFAIIPSAILFIINQWHQNGQLRSEKHRYITERYHMFLDRCLENSDLRLQDAQPIPKHELNKEQIYRRDILFDLLTSIFELAYLTYAHRISSHRSRQWGGWEAYIIFYMELPDYREFWIRVLLDDDRSGIDGRASLKTRASVTQYDLKFEKYMFGRLRLAEKAEVPRGVEANLRLGRSKARPPRKHSKQQQKPRST
jgi:hypothetical protein